MSSLTVSHRARRRGLILLLLASVVIPAVATAQSAQSRRRTPCADCESEARRLKALERLDSLRWEFEHEKLSDAQRERLRVEMAVAIRDLQLAIGDLRSEMGDLERAQVEAIAGTPRLAFAYKVQQHGYLGVSFDGPNAEEIRGNERIIRFFAYPKIALVEPSSPAERAGIRAGDTLLAMNGVDVVDREISLTRMLVPDEALAVKLRREGSVRDVKVTVGRPPAYVQSRWAAPVAAAEAPGAVARVRTAPPARDPGAVMPARPPSAVTSVWVYSDGVAGAKVETVTEGLSKALGVDGGVLVLRAGPGTPALRAGLRDGDVIVRAGGMRVANVRELREALHQHDEGGGVKLVIVRERKQREVTLRQ